MGLLLPTIYKIEIMKNIYILSLLLLPFMVLSQEGELDISFNGDGKFIHENKNKAEQAYDVQLQADGKILMIGPSAQSSWDKTWIMRLDIYGNPDPKFGNQGLVEMEMGGTQSIGTALAVQGDGKIIVGGTSEYSDDRGFSARRLMDNGQPDLSFGDSSYVFLPFSNFSHLTQFVGIQGDGKIILGAQVYTNTLGIALARLMPDGSPDYSFGDSAVTVLSLPSSVTCNQFTMKQDGGIIAVGYTYSNSQQAFALVQTNADGQLDASFGSNGLIVISFSDDAEAEAVAVQADGKVVAAGNTNVNGLSNFAVIRLLADGTLDQSFGINGKTTHEIMSNDAFGKAVAILGDGKILVAGDAYGLWNRDFALARFTSGGKIDNSFSIDGFTTKNMGNGNDYVHDAILQPNGRLVVVGSTYYTYNSSSSSASYDIAAARFLGGAPTFGEAELDVYQIAVYPNPASSVLNIEMDDPFTEYEAELVDLSGKVYSRISLAGSGSIDVSLMNSGLYILRMYQNTMPIGSVKVMVE